MLGDDANKQDKVVADKDESFSRDDPSLEDALLEVCEISAAPISLKDDRTILGLGSLYKPYRIDLQIYSHFAVNPNQKGNGLLKSLDKIHAIFDENISPAHYVLSDSCCALFISLNYHIIHPNYIGEIVDKVRKSYRLKLLLVLIDHTTFEKHLQNLTMLAIRTDFTLLVGWSFDDMARHITNYRLSAGKPADMIKGLEGGNLQAYESLTRALTQVKSVDRLVAANLLANFGTFENLVKADVDGLKMCDNISDTKAERLKQFFDKPFIR